MMIASWIIRGMGPSRQKGLIKALMHKERPDSCPRIKGSWVQEFYFKNLEIRIVEWIMLPAMDDQGRPC